MNAKSSYQIIFAGTPEFAATILESLLESSHTITAVYTQPDRPAGRGQKLTSSPVKTLAQKYNLPIYQPQTLKDENEQQILKNLQADIMIVVAFGLLLPLPILKAPRLGCINIHASLLPRWRGAAPIQHAILENDNETGISIMQMDEGLDTGPVLLKMTCSITATETCESLHDKLAALGAKAILETLEKFETLIPEAQNSTLATYASKIKKESAKINWQLPAEIIERQIRAFYAWPVSFTQLNDKIIRVWSATVIDKISRELPGKILQTSKAGIDVATGLGVIRLLSLQLPGGRVLSVSEILNAQKNDFVPGLIFS